MLHFEMHATPMQAQSYPMLGGDAGVEQTIRAMRRIIDQGKKDPNIHELAANILREQGIAAFDWVGEIRAIGEWVGQHVRFTRDVYGKETLHHPNEIVRLGIGDCDDFTILICSLLGTIGVKTRIVTISSPRLDASQFTHVFPEAEADGKWYPVDFARRSPQFGLGPQTFARRREWSTSDDHYVDVQGLGANAAATMRPTRPTRTATTIPPPNGVRNPSWGPGAMRGVGFRPNALPGAYQANVPDPRFQRLRSTPFIGTGHYGAKQIAQASAKAAGMGDDSDFDWSTLVSTLPADLIAATTGAANVITAERANPNNLFPTTSVTGSSSSSAATTAALLAAQANPLNALFSNPLLLILLVGGIMLAEGGGRH